MAITSATLKVSSNESVGLTQATVTYSASGTLPDDLERKSYMYRYRNADYSWTFSPGGGTSSSSSGTKTITGLTQGAANTITATVTLKCDRHYYTRNDDDTAWIYEDTDTYTVDTETVTLIVYTRPGVFTGFDGSRDQLINEVINSTSAANWNTHCGKYLSWKNQASKYGTVTVAFPSGQLITAAWFNSLRTACGATEAQVPVAVRDQTLITADIFKKLGAAISKS